MKRLSLAVVLALVVVFSLTATTGDEVYAQGPSIKLTPESGFAAVTIEGTGFIKTGEVYGIVTITFGGVAVPTYPSPVRVDYGNFVAIITVPQQVAPGVYLVTATGFSEAGSPTTEQATDYFTVEDMTGPPGPPGPQGPPGEQGPEGTTSATSGVGIAALLLALIALGLMIASKVKKWVFE